jgi:hypothetical protein
MELADALRSARAYDLEQPRYAALLFRRSRFVWAMVLADRVERGAVSAFRNVRDGEECHAAPPALWQAPRASRVRPAP